MIMIYRREPDFNICDINFNCKIIRQIFRYTAIFIYYKTRILQIIQLTYRSKSYYKKFEWKIEKKNKKCYILFKY